MFKEMTEDEFKDFIQREVPHLYYIGQVKHRKAIGLSGLKNEKRLWDKHSCCHNVRGDGNQREEENFSKGEP